MRAELLAGGAPESMVEDAVLVLSELLSNACRHARPLGSVAAFPRGAHPPQDYVHAAWRWRPDGELTISVTDGGDPTRPFPATPSITARGGRGLAIVTHLARDWGVTEGEAADGVTVWAVLTPSDQCADLPRQTRQRRPALDLIDLDDFV